jgi:hypothetical protein
MGKKVLYLFPFQEKGCNKKNAHFFRRYGYVLILGTCGVDCFYGAAAFLLRLARVSPFVIGNNPFDPRLEMSVKW